MKKNIVIFEVEGGNDKWINGLRKDTVPIANAIRKLGWLCEVVYYRDEWADEIYEYSKEKFDAYISRINPGNLKGGEKNYFRMLNKLCQNNLLGMAHPDEMLLLGAKNILTKLIPSELVRSDVYLYDNATMLRKNLPVLLSKGPRVIKQNRGSTGKGIWKVEIWESKNILDNNSDNIILKCIEAVDNQVHYYTLEYFYKVCEKYLSGKHGMLIDMPYLDRINEGEFRILLVGDTAVSVIHKKPKNIKDSFSTTLFSGATYIYNKPEDHPKLISVFKRNMDDIFEKLGKINTPLLWTADFILDNDDSSNDKYVLSEVNCSCVGFTSNLEEGIQDLIAKEAVKRIKNHHLKESI